MNSGFRNISTKLLLLCSLLVVVLSFGTKAAQPNKYFDEYEILKVDSACATIYKAQQSSEFQKFKHINFGYTTDAYWIKMPLNDITSSVPMYAVSEFRCMDFIDFYLSRNGIITDSLITGYLRPLSSREKTFSRLVFRLPENITENDTLYVKIQKQEGTLHTRFSVTDEIHLLKTIHTEKQALFFFFGVCFLMLIFSFSYFLYFRKSMFLWYMLFITSFALHQLSNFGYGSIYVWKDWFWLSNISRVIFNVPAVLGILLFSFGLLRVKEFSPVFIQKAYKYLVIYFSVMLIFPFVPIPTYPYRFGVYAIFLFSIPAAMLTIIIAAYNAIKNRHLPGYFIMAGEMVLISIMMLFVLRNFSLLPAQFTENYLSDYVILYMAIISMSFGLISMLSYTKEMHYRIVREYIAQPKPEPKSYTEEEQEKLKEIYLKLETYFEAEKPYLDPALHLSDLAYKIDIQDHLISKAINFKAEMHFFDFVNSYRVKEAARLLADEATMKTYTIEALAKQCGFSNKTSFNKAFKKFTGQTPTSYRQKH